MASKQYFSLDLVAACAITLAILTGCKTEELVNDSGTLGGTGNGVVATPTPTASPTPTVTPTPIPPDLDAAMYFLVDTAWDLALNNPQSQIPTEVDGGPPILPIPSGCLIPTGSTPLDAIALSHTCVFMVPEAQLYFSKVTMKIGSSDTVNCKYMKLYPYFYSIDGSSTPPGPSFTPTPAPITPVWSNSGTRQDISCYGFTGGAIPHPVEANGIPYAELLAHPEMLLYSTAGCYNGPATTIPGFPFATSVFTENQFAMQLKFEIDSGRNTQQNSNRWAANDSLDISVNGAPAIAGEYKANSMHNYVAMCLNEFGQISYQMEIILGAESDLTGSPATVYKSWR